MKTIFYTLTAAVTLAAAFALPAGASTIASATFDTGTSGWTSESFLADPNDDHPIFTSPLATYGLTWSATDGNPGGTVNGADQDSGWQYFVASSAFLGNQSAALGGTLSFDLERTDANASFPAQSGPPLAITDGTTILVFAPVSGPVNGSYTTYTFNLSTLAGGVFVTSDSGAAATQAQLETVLSNLTGLYILGDWYTGIGDAYNLDNVILSRPDSPSSVPEPSSFLFMSTGGLALLAWRKRVL